MVCFFINFCSWFLIPQAMKYTFIYRGWKKDVWSPLVPNLGPWFDLEGSQPLVQNSYHRLSYLLHEKGWLGWPLWSGVTTTMELVRQNIWSINHLRKEATRATFMEKKMNNNLETTSFWFFFILVLWFVMFLNYTPDWL